MGTDRYVFYRRPGGGMFAVETYRHPQDRGYQDAWQVGRTGKITHIGIHKNTVNSLRPLSVEQAAEISSELIDYLKGKTKGLE